MNSSLHALLQFTGVSDLLPITWFSVAVLGSVIGVLGVVLVPLSKYDRMESIIEWCYYRGGYEKFMDVCRGHPADRGDRGFYSLINLLDTYGNFDELNRSRDDIARIRIGNPANDVFVVFYSGKPVGQRDHESVSGLNETKKRVVREPQPKIDTTLTWIGRVGWILRFVAGVLGLLYLIRPR